VGSYTSRVNAYKPASDGSEAPSVATDINHNVDVLENGLGAVPTVATPASAFDGKIVNVDGRPYFANGAMPGGTWVEIGQQVPLIKTADESIASTTIPQWDAELHTDLPPGLFEFSGRVIYATPNTVDLKFGLIVPGTGWAAWDAVYKPFLEADGNTSVTPHDSLTATSEPLAGGWQANNTSKMRVRFGGLLDTGTGGTAGFRWSQVTSSATQTWVFQRSYLIFRRVG
jgi:hypothetical protein